MVSGTLWSMADQRDEAVRKGAHGAWQLHYHIVFPVKYRKALLDEAVTTIIRDGGRDRGTVSDRDGSDGDGQESHPSALQCSAHPKVAPGRIVQIFKSITARQIFRRKPAVKRVLWGGEFWSDGYYVATVGERANWQTVERYVQRQGQPREDLQQLRMF